MKRLNLVIGGEALPFYMGENCIEEMCSMLSGLDADRYVIVTDDGVRAALGADQVAALGRSRPTLILSDTSGERSKTLPLLTEYAERAIEWGVSRRSVVVTLGGGVPGNLGGLLAALLFRGVRLIHVPTTLIGMLDSVISYKQTVNSRLGKNLFGTFYRPTMIMADIGTLYTLPVKEVRAGICEVIKNALAIHPHMIEPLLDILNPDCEYDYLSYSFLLEASVASKGEVMAADHHEKSRALILEYGHTIGHAIELSDQCTAGEERISHGEAVGLGMLGAADIANSVGGLDNSEVALHHLLLSRAGARRGIPPRIETSEIMKLIRFDNKRGYRATNTDSIDMILLRKLGVPLGDLHMPLTSVYFESVQNVVESLRVES